MMDIYLLWHISLHFLLMESLMISQKNIITSILKLPLKHGRRFVAIVGPPAGGKSTLANELQQQISGSCVVPITYPTRNSKWLVCMIVKDHQKPLMLGD